MDKSKTDGVEKMVNGVYSLMSYLVGLVVVLVFAGIGYLVSLYLKFKSNSAIQVRPNLRDVGFLQAVSTNHGGDWLFYHYPTGSTLFTIGFFTVIALLFVWRFYFIYRA